MTEQEYILICLMEECAEVQQACSKALRFGPDNHHPDTPEVSNKDKIKDELRDISAVHMLMVRGPDTPDITYKELEDRIDKIKKYAQVSRDLGIIQETQWK